MKFSFEVPIHSLSKFNKEQDYLFILAHLLNNKKYFNYCKKSKKYKILDNSAYELGESLDPKKLITLAVQIKADVIIIPDKLFDKKRSEELQKEFMYLLKPLRKRFKLMKVVCGNNIPEYIESLIEVAEDTECDIIGMSQSRNMITPGLTYCMQMLYEYAESPIAFTKPIHLLGLTSPFELIEAREWKQIESIDTGRPINFAFAKKEFPMLDKVIDYQKVSGLDIDTRRKLDIKLAKKNIKILKKYYYGK